MVCRLFRCSLWVIFSRSDNSYLAKRLSVWHWGCITYYWQSSVGLLHWRERIQRRTYRRACRHGCAFIWYYGCYHYRDFFSQLTYLSRTLTIHRAIGNIGSVKYPFPVYFMHRLISNFLCCCYIFTQAHHA